MTELQKAQNEAEQWKKTAEILNQTNLRLEAELRQGHKYPKTIAKIELQAILSGHSKNSRSRAYDNINSAKAFILSAEQALNVKNFTVLDGCGPGLYLNLHEISQILL